MTVQDVQTGEKEVCSYDRLVVAVGASPAILPIEGKELAGVFKMRTPDDAEGIRTYAEQNNVKKAVVIGAGFIGLEAAENLQAKGIQVTVIDFADQILPNIFDPEMALYAKRHLSGRESACLQERKRSRYMKEVHRAVWRELRRLPEICRVK